MTRIATPSFVLISGVTLAVLFARSRSGFAATRDRLVDRGLFLILVGHPLFMVANRYMESSWADAIRVVFITDTIGAAVIVGALVIARAGPRTRLLRPRAAARRLDDGAGVESAHPEHVVAREGSPGRRRA